MGDTEIDDIFPHLDAATEFIHESVEKKIPILVHCHAGISRSGSCVIAYMMKYGGIPEFFVALQFVKKQRSLVRPNATFGKALIKFQEKLANEKGIPTQVGGMSAAQVLQKQADLKVAVEKIEVAEVVMVKIPEEKQAKIPLM